MKLAADFDAGKDIDTPVTPAVPEEKLAAERPAARAESKTQPEAKEAAEDSKAPEVKSGLKAEQEQEPKSDDDKEKSRWARNRERKERTWEEINAEKEALRREKEAIQREKESVQKAKLGNEPLKDEHGATATEYRKAAEWLRGKGDEQSKAQADAAEKLARRLDEKEQQLKQQRYVEELQTSWKRNYDDLADKHPALKDQNSELYKAAVAVINEFPLLAQNPDGLKYAVRAAEINLQAQEFEGTKTEYAKLKAEYEKLQKKMSIEPGQPTTAPEAKKSFGEMSIKEQERALEQAAREADRAAGFI